MIGVVAMERVDSRFGDHVEAVRMVEQLMRSDGKLVLLVLRLPPERFALMMKEWNVSVLGAWNDLGLVGLGHQELSIVYPSSILPVS